MPNEFAAAERTPEPDVSYDILGEKFTTAYDEKNSIYPIVFQSYREPIYQKIEKSITPLKNLFYVQKLTRK